MRQCFEYTLEVPKHVYTTTSYMFLPYILYEWTVICNEIQTFCWRSKILQLLIKTSSPRKKWWEWCESIRAWLGINNDEMLGEEKRGRQGVCICLWHGWQMHAQVRERKTLLKRGRCNDVALTSFGASLWRRWPLRQGCKG